MNDLHSSYAYTMEDLRAICRIRGLSADGEREELIARLRGSDASQGSGEAPDPGVIDTVTAESSVYTSLERTLIAQLRAVTAALAEYGLTVPEWSADAPTYAERLGATVRQVCQTASRVEEAERDANTPKNFCNPNG